MLVLGTHVTIVKYWGTGPLWPFAESMEPYCGVSWWTNLLYINNLVNIDKQVHKSYSIDSIAYLLPPASEGWKEMFLHVSQGRGGTPWSLVPNSFLWGTHWSPVPGPFWWGTPGPRGTPPGQDRDIRPVRIRVPPGHDRGIPSPGRMCGGRGMPLAT